jgi:soluble lytic murein transglycosylase-like protein
MNFAGENVPLEDPEIRERLDRELLVNNYWQSNALLMIKRAHKYFPIIEPILKKNGVPDDFKYLALAESGFMQVVSPAGATGFWQIMEATGKEYGLEINSNIDERYHIEKATEVACQYFLNSKKRFGNWTLSAAAYNAGNTGVNRQLERQEATDYYDLLLVEETSRYVFRILALKEIIGNYKDYGFIIEEKDMYKLAPVTNVEIDTSVSNLASLARGYGISYKTLKRYNPWLRDKNLENYSGRLYEIQIPDSTAYIFRSKKSQK